MPDCIFCKIIAGAIPAEKVYEDEHVLAFLDIKPINPGHTLVIPKRHAECLLGTTESEARAVMDAVKKIAPGILRAVGANAFNLSNNCGKAAGQIVLHTHFHLMPRFEGDGYKPWAREDGGKDLAAVAEKIRKELAV